jgi:iron-sulfur cluster assembly accessory protein
MSITPPAAAFIRRMLRLGGGGDSGFRLVVSHGGCAGLAAAFSVEAQPQPGDAVMEYEELKLFLPPQSCVLLAGVTVDFSDSPMQSGLVFRDPKAAACNSCSLARRH